MFVEEWASGLCRELGAYTDPAAGLPSAGWVAAQAARVLLQYPSGLPRGVLLTEIEMAWNMSLRRGEHAGRLKQVLSSKQLALGTSIGGTLLGGADEFRYRLAVDDQWMDVIMHSQFQDWLGFLKHVGCSLDASSERIGAAFVNCRLLKTSIRKPALLPAEQGVFQLDGRSCSRLIEGPLMDLHTDFMNDYAAMIAAPMNDRISGAFARVLEVSPALPYPQQSAGPGRAVRAQQFCTVLLRLQAPREEGEGPPVYLVLFDNQIDMCKLLREGEMIFFYRPWVALNQEERAVFGGSLDQSHQAIGYAVNTEAAAHLAPEAGRSVHGVCGGGGGIHLCLGAVSCVSVMGVAGDFAGAATQTTSLSAAGSSVLSGDLWGRVLRVLYVPQSRYSRGSGRRIATVLLEIVQRGESSCFPTTYKCKYGCRLDADRVYVALQCGTDELPGVAGAAGRALKPGHLALCTGVAVHRMAHLRVVAEGAPVEAGATLCYASSSGGFCPDTAEAAGKEALKCLQRLLRPEAERAQHAAICSQRAGEGVGGATGARSPDSVAVDHDVRTDGTGGVKRKAVEMEARASALECCVLFERPLLAPAWSAGPSRSPGAGHIMNFSCIAALACSPSLMSPSLTFIRDVADGERGAASASPFGILYGHILQWVLLDGASGRAAAVARLLVMDSSGSEMWLQIDSDCSVASGAIVVSPSFGCSAAAGAQFCLCVSRMAAPGPGGCTHRIDVVADVNPRGAAWALQHAARCDCNSNSRSDSCSGEY